jgi:hypothetical protein
MHAFEELVSEILWSEGFWVQTSVKVKLTSDDKAKIGKHSMPRPELDIVAFNAKRNLLCVVECKSFIDSKGVSSNAFDGRSEVAAKRYKLFNDTRLRTVVFRRLKQQFVEAGLCLPTAKVQLCLVCGRITSNRERVALRKHFAAKGWKLFEEQWLKEGLSRMADSGYENRISALVSKLIIRGRLDQPSA